MSGALFEWLELELEMPLIEFELDLESLTEAQWKLESTLVEAELEFDGIDMAALD